MLLATLAALVAAAAPESYVIVVGNNQSPVLGRPQLAYADDDAVRYAEVFEAVLRAPRVELLAELDDDTSRLFPREVERAAAPTRANVLAAFARLSAWAAEAKQAGRRTRGYFVFAGHGDMADGEGFLELKDARLTGRDLEGLLQAAGADELHVVLDACNSWFVLSPRKPGGRRFPTPAEATRALTERLPNVGVLLSTSAEAEVYEWSELQSGIFSYALRSALVGAADADGDGDLAYDELAAFIDAATRSIKNPNLRPHVFARAPGGGVSGAFASLEEARAVRLTSAGAEPLRLRVRDAAGVRWFDASLDQGRVTLRLPPRMAEGAVVERCEGGAWSSYPLPPGAAQVDLAELREPVALGRSRGATDALQALFETPFGAAERERWRTAEAARQDTAPIGVSRATVSRVGFMLSLAGQRDHSGRLSLGVMGGGLGLAAAGFYVSMGASTTDPWLRPFAFTTAGAMAALGVSMGLVALFVPTMWERQSAAFSRLVGQGKADQAILELDRFLDERLADYATGRLMNRILAAVTAAGGLALLGYGLFSRDPEAVRNTLVATGGLAVAAGGTLFATTFWIRLPEQDLYDAIREERRVGDLSVSVGVAPVPQGALVAISGQF